MRETMETFAIFTKIRVMICLLMVVRQVALKSKNRVEDIAQSIKFCYERTKTGRPLELLTTQCINWCVHSERLTQKQKISPEEQYQYLTSYMNMHTHKYEKITYLLYKNILYFGTQIFFYFPLVTYQVLYFLNLVT